jgi:hypothetical protein
VDIARARRLLAESCAYLYDDAMRFSHSHQRD